MTDRLTALLAERPWLLADGATGSNLFERGLQSGDAPELWNSEHPQRVAQLQRAFVEAGADIILTNSFGGTRHRLKLHKAEDRVAELNEKAARITRTEADRAGRVVLVAGSMGPTGEILEPLGPLSQNAAREAFAEQAIALARGGADLLWIETMSSVEETEAAVAGARATGLPVVATLSFDTNGRTMMGITPYELAGLHSKLELAACGSNCGTGPSELVACMVNLATASAPAAILVAKANCGIPQFIDGEIRFNGTPDLMAKYACLSLDAGARIIGGCCGTTPEHLRVMRRALEAHVRGPKPDLATIESSLGAISSGATAQLRGELSRQAGAAAGAAGRRTTNRRGARAENT
ncbi:MAG TPA: betaine--homocysteine S-methyltransferase [Steroidobacteraceae bacterium]|jgi:5-methyltetrahydrofolate--homocysteine methyltransferase|nr:betaine--homocysteine S-methyltransferase [Steroidobacteraceae bacterium]